MTREDIEGRDQETDDDGEILIPCTNPASCACGKATGECRPSGPRPPDYDRLVARAMVDKTPSFSHREATIHKTD